MNKIFLIIKREYLSRVRKKSFLIMTVLGPILMSAMFIIPVWMATREGDEKVIHVLDESGFFLEEFESNETTTYVYVAGSLETAKKILNQGSIFGLLHIPKITLDDVDGIKFYSLQNPGMSIQSSLERRIRSKIEDEKLIISGLDKDVIDNLKSYASVNIVKLSDTGDESESNAGVASAVGYVSAFLIYIFTFMYGAMTMRGVVEEKTNRIIEVVISSVKPFQLMMGKIIGVGSVGLTQFLLWVVLSTAIVMAGSYFIMGDLTPDQQVALQSSQAMGPQIQASGEQQMVMDAMGSLEQLNIPFIIGCFVFYFIGGYLCYGALFAAIGAAVDNETDTQQFMLPVTMPLVLSFISLSAVINEPNGTLAFWLSVIPFTSPVIMMMRLPFEVPMWQLALSMLSLILGFVFTTWMASRIYRVGIFMHGTKVNYKTLFKWFMLKN
ncbi:MAG: ABC transporter permease [Reichenbachiella sp.]